MWIIDLTKFLMKRHNNYHVFNPSVICLSPTDLPIINTKHTICIMTYRLASYDIHEAYHPWKIWDNGYKYFMNPKKVIHGKYRDVIGGSFEIPLQNVDLIQRTAEHDSTGLAIFTFDGKTFDLIYDMPNLFNYEMN